MNRRAFRLLAALAAGLLLLLLFVERTVRDAPEAVGDLLLPGLAAQVDSVDRIIVDRAGEAQDVTIRRKSKSWVVADHGDYPVDVGKLRRLVTELADARIVEESTSIADNYDRIGVDDPGTGGGGTLVRLEGEGVEQAIIVGNAAQRDYRYARVPGAARSYLVNKNPALPADAAGWLDREVMSLDPERIRRVEIAHVDGETIVIEKAGEEGTDFVVRDIPDGRELSYPGIGGSVARALESLSLEDVRANFDGPVSTTTTFDTLDGLTVTARVATLDGQQWVAFDASADEEGTATGEAAEINDRVAGWWYSLPAYKADLFARRWDDLLAGEQSDD